MPFQSDTLAIVMAGGVGARLSPLTSDRAKPAVPFGGQYRIIDFTLSNCLHSGLRQVLVLTQYKSHSMQIHLRDGWSAFNPEMGEYITAVPPQMRTGDSWYAGTADALYQNLYLIERSGAKNVIVLSGDHVYRMDYSEMIRQHDESLADLTIACMEVGIGEANSFGIMSVDEDHLIHEFEEKPSSPTSIPGHPDRALASMGVYVFTIDVLCDQLRADHQIADSTHDFGNDVIPRLIEDHRVYGHRFRDACNHAGNPYWRDVGTIDAYYRTNMDLLKRRPLLDLNCPDWPIRKYDSPAPPARIVRDESGDLGVLSDSIISNGVTIEGGHVEHSILSPNVRISSGANIAYSILFDNVHVGEGAVLRNCIIDKDVFVPAGETVGVDPSLDSSRFTVSPSGIIVVPKGYRFPPETPASVGRLEHRSAMNRDAATVTPR